MTASLADGEGTVFASAPFQGTAEAGPPAEIDVSQTATTGFVGETVGVAVTEVRDGFGNAIAVAPLTWEIVTGSGSITGDAKTAGSTAQGTWTLGLGTNEARVVSGDAKGTFTAIVGQCFDGFGSATIDGVEMGDEWSCATTVPVSVNLGGGATDGVLKTMNDGDNAYFLLRVQQGTGSELNSLRFDFDSDEVTGASALDDVLVFDPAADTSIDGYLSAKCENRSQTTCFAVDPNGQEVDADVSNDGSFTTYEVSHALASGQSEDIDASDGQPIGFFFTLFNGNGAKGNTQFPGFRVYELFFQAVTPGS